MARYTNLRKLENHENHVSHVVFTTLTRTREKTGYATRYISDLKKIHFIAKRRKQMCNFVANSCFNRGDPSMVR
jgi:hypothetical protein